MAKLIYTAIASLDGYIEDSSGSFTWAEPDEEVHRFANDLDRSVGRSLYGRIWRGKDKVVFSRSLEAASSERTSIEREFDPELVRRWKSESDADLSIGGAELAGHALRAGRVDLHSFPSGFVHLGYRVKV